MRVAGIDQGTTSTRAIIVTADGSLEVVLARPHRQRYPRPGWVEQAPEELLANLRACVAAAGKLDALGIDNQGESCLAWDAETGEALSPVVSWQDSRTFERLERLRGDGQEPEIQRRSGLPLDPYFSASKLGWIVDTLPAARAAHAKGRLRLGTTDAFFLDRLTGRFVTDVTTASRTSLMNLETLQWDPTLCELFGVPMACLPRIVPTTGDFGSLMTEHGPVPVTASVVDQQAALYGFGCRRKGQAKITFGTGAFALMVTGEEIVNRPDLGLLPTVGWQFAGENPVYAVDGGVFTASSAIDWARSLNLFTDYAELNALGGPPAAASGLVFVPALAGLGCPHWEPRARGSWFGLSLEHSGEQLMRSVLEGIALRASEVLEAMDQCIGLEGALFIDGGMSRNPYFNQFLSDVSGRVVRPATMPELTGLGTILLASHAAGQSVDAIPEFGRFEPNGSEDDYRALFRRAVAMSRDWARG